MVPEGDSQLILPSSEDPRPGSPGGAAVPPCPPPGKLRCAMPRRPRRKATPGCPTRKSLGGRLTRAREELQRLDATIASLGADYATAIDPENATAQEAEAIAVQHDQASADRRGVLAEIEALEWVRQEADELPASRCIEAGYLTSRLRARVRAMERDRRDDARARYREYRERRALAGEILHRVRHAGDVRTIDPFADLVRESPSLARRLAPARKKDRGRELDLSELGPILCQEFALDRAVCRADPEGGRALYSALRPVLDPPRQVRSFLPVLDDADREELEEIREGIRRALGLELRVPGL